MAIYHLSMQNISRGKGQSAIASASYRSGEKLYSERYGESNFYAREVQPTTFILAPDHAPEWATNRQRLWNEVEAVEKSKNSRLAKEFNIALPIELSHDEQEKLAKEYVQENFVNRGMVADVSIHRDDENNPHFHVMTTLREIDENGKWKAKARKIYINDENDEPLYYDNGERKSRKENLNDWNDKDTLKEWRKNWADTANLYLERSGHADRISEKSYTELGLEIEPTIHEGYVARQMEKRGEISERCEKNREISARNLASNQTKEKEEKQAENVRKIIHKEYADEGTSVSNSLSPNEKKSLSSIAKNLKIYVNYENLIDKERMLNNWTDKVELNAYVHLDIADEETIENIQQTSKDIEEGKDILERQADRIYQKYYPEFAEKKKLDTYYKIALADKTLKEDKVLNPIEIQEVMEEAKDNHANFMMKSIAKNPYIQPVKTYQNNIANLKEQMDNIEEDLEKQGQTVQTASDDIKHEYKDLMKKASLQLTTLKIMNKYYSDTIKDKYPSYDVNSLNVNDKEQLSKAMDYYGNRYTIDDMEYVIKHGKTNKYSYMELKAGLNMINEIENGKLQKGQSHIYPSNPRLQEIYQTVSDKEMQNIFLQEAKDSGLLSDLSDSQTYNNQQSYSSNPLGQLFNKTDILSSLYQAQEDNLRREQQAERDRNKHKAKKKKTKKRKYREKPKYNTMKR